MTEPRTGHAHDVQTSDGGAPKGTPTEALSAVGVSIWLDDLSRDVLDSGELADLIATRDVTGVTTNPTIFAAALARGQAYDAQVSDLARAGASVEQTALALIAADVARACDVLQPQYAASAGRDGRVSIEVDPRLAYDTDQTVAQAHALHAAVDRPNVMIKIPATHEGLAAATQVLGDGISVNVTLIFALDRYREVIDAYLAGLELAQRNGHDLSTIHSVASFFVSRVDAAIDARLDQLADGRAGTRATELRSRAGVANARLAYQLWRHEFATPRARQLLNNGANAQRPLWASTGVKDPALPDTYYVEELAAPDTVNTMPAKTLAATYDHASIRGDAITGTDAEAREQLDALADVGIDIDDVTTTLEKDGVVKFIDSWTQLLGTVSTAVQAARLTPPS